MTRCEATEWHPGIGGVDDLPGDLGYAVRCENVAVKRLRFTYPFDPIADVQWVCEEHLTPLDEHTQEV